MALFLPALAGRTSVFEVNMALSHAMHRAIFHLDMDGLTLISESEKVQFLRPLPARVLYGVGKVTE
jgi:hypothetical protein